MAAGLVVPVSGPYVAVWNALPLGVQSDDGYALSCTVAGQEVNATDQYGQTLVEGVYQGQNWRCRLRGLEWKTGLLAILQMFGQVRGDNSLNPTLSGINPLTLPVVNVGDLWTNYAKILVLAAILGNPPSSPQTLTAATAALAPGQTSEFMMTSKVRELPLELVLIPYSTVISSRTYAIPFSAL